MKKNEKSQALLMNCRCNYSHMIYGTYNLVLSCHFQKEYKLHLTYPIIIEDNLKKVGHKFILKRSDLGLDIFYELTELIITDYYGYFRYHVYKTIPESFEYDHIIEVRYVNEDECIIFTSFVYKNNIFFSEKEIQEEIYFRRNLYNNIVSSLRKFEILKISTASAVIKSKIELIWDIIRNIKLIHKYAHLLGDKINYKGEILKKDLIIQIIDFKGKSIYKFNAKVDKCLMRNTNTTKNCVIEILFQKDKDITLSFSLKKINIYIYEYNGISTIHVLYFFNNIQKNSELFSNYNKKKNEELTKFKYIIENYIRKTNRLELNDKGNKSNYKSDFYNFHNK